MLLLIDILAIVTINRIDSERLDCSYLLLNISLLDLITVSFNKHC